LEYAVNVCTGDKYGAGTDSNVFVIIYGENGDSGEINYKGRNNCQVSRPVDKL